jgi:predicted metalloprotease with PDZ domain
MLAADLRLRELSGGSQTLGDALHEIHQCCLNEMYRWRAEDFVARLDAATGTAVFSELFEQQIQARPFPEYDALYERLGIRILGGHPIFVGGESARYRNAIMAPRRVSDE